MSDDLRDRIARIDPMPSDVPVEPVTSEKSRQLLEEVMSTELKERSESAPVPRRTWTLAIAALAALVVAIGGVIAFAGGDDPAPIAAEPLHLTAPADNTMASCIMFSPEELARVGDIAFGGTVTSVDGSTVNLTVDEWFKGGEASEVILDAPQGMEALIGGIPFAVGEQYLITATNGTVNYCGFSGPATPEYRAAFQQAFGG
jgi:hypothetical protein